VCDSFRYKIAPLIVAKGHTEVDMNDVRIGFGLQFTTQIAPNGRQLMKCNTVDIIVDINRNDIKIHISGNWLSDLGSIFTVFFKGTVCDLINDAINSALSTTLPNLINANLIENDGYIPFPGDWKLDWESPSPAVVATEDWCLHTKGMFFNPSVGEIEPTGVVIPSMPCKDTSSPA